MNFNTPSISQPVIPGAKNAYGSPTDSNGFIPGINFGAIASKLTGNGGDIFPGINFSAQPTSSAPASYPAITPQNDSTTNIASQTSNGYTAGGSTAPVDLSSYDSAINQYNSSLGRLGTQLDIAKGNVNQQYGTNLNQLDSSKNAAQNQYSTSTTQNGQSLRTNKNTITDNQSAGLRGLLRTLGAYGAGGSSDAMYVAPQAVATQASQQRAGAGQTYAQNQQGLDTNWNNFLGQDQNSRKQLNDWQSNQLNNVQQQSDTTKQDLLSKLADITGQRAAAAGGSYATGAQPYLDQVAGLNSTIDNLGRSVATYNGTTPTYTAPTLDSYQAQSASAKVDPSTLQGGNNPYLAMILGQQKDKNGNPIS